MKFEYGIAHHSYVDFVKNKVYGSHRWGMTREEADQWIKEWEDDGTNKGSMVKIRRPINEWEIADD